MGGIENNTMRPGRSHREGPRIGLLAGWGRYPILLAETLQRQGRQVYCLGMVGHADARLADLCDDFRWSGLAKLGGAIRYFKRHDVTDVIMAGKIHKRLMFQPWLVLRHVPDWQTIRAFVPHFLSRQKDCKDDTLMGRLITMFADSGIRFGAPTDYAPELLVREGQLTRRGPSASQSKDIQFGWEVAKELGRLDIGQSVAVKNQATLAVEAVEGTDQCIRRAGSLCEAGEFTVVKVAKPQQDMRFDVPTIGPGTLHTLVEASGRVLAIEARRTVILDQQDVIDFADQHKLIIVALENNPSAAVQSRPAAEPCERTGANISENPCRSRER